MNNQNFHFKFGSKSIYTRKYPLRRYFLAPPETRQIITLKRDKIFFGHTDYGPRITDHWDGQTDVEVEIVF